MTQIIKGRFHDHRGGGWMLSRFSTRGHVLIAWRERWRIAYVRPPQKPDYQRLYLGWIEIEWSKTPCP